MTANDRRPGVRAIREQGNPAPDDLKPSPNLARDASQ